jgi:hypothetical protein
MLQSKPVYFATVISLFLILDSCSLPKKSANNINRNDLKGTWILENISFEGLPENQKFKLTLLDEGSEECLKGSSWTFPNNGNGSYTITQNRTGCTTGERNIVWSHRVENGQDILQYKKLTGGVKAKDITEGYKFNIVSVTVTRLQLSSKIFFEGNSVSVNYVLAKK